MGNGNWNRLWVPSSCFGRVFQLVFANMEYCDLDIPGKKGLRIGFSPSLPPPLFQVKYNVSYVNIMMFIIVNIKIF